MLDRTDALARQASQKGAEHLARQTASALYHLTASVTMAWEATQIGSSQRLLLADLVLSHRLIPRDPLSPIQEESLQCLFQSGSKNEHAGRYPTHVSKPINNSPLASNLTE